MSSNKISLHDKARNVEKQLMNGGYSFKEKRKIAAKMMGIETTAIYEKAKAMEEQLINEGYSLKARKQIVKTLKRIIRIFGAGND